MLRSERYDANGTSLQQADSAVKRQSRDGAVVDQAFFLEGWQDHALIHYGDDVVEVTSDMAAADVASALECLETVRDVWVAGAGTPESPWTVVFLDADVDAGGAHYLLQREVQAQAMVRALDVAGLVVLDEEHLGQRHAQHLRDVVEQLAEHQRVALELATILPLDARIYEENKMFNLMLSLFLVLLMAAPPWVISQGTQGAEESKTFKQEELDQMLAPIALYPDDLLTQILIASTYPLEIVQADRWTKQNKNLKGNALTEALEKEDWDPSVKSLVNFLLRW